MTRNTWSKQSCTPITTLKCSFNIFLHTFALLSLCVGLRLVIPNWSPAGDTRCDNSVFGRVSHYFIFLMSTWNTWFCQMLTITLRLPIFMFKFYNSLRNVCHFCLPNVSFTSTPYAAIVKLIDFCSLSRSERGRKCKRSAVGMRRWWTRVGGWEWISPLNAVSWHVHHTMPGQSLKSMHPANESY